MTKEDRIAFLVKAHAAAYQAGHVWPLYAACEAALESRYGDSKLARLANNLFGLKQGHSTAGYATIILPTQEWDNTLRAMVPATATWPIFANWIDCFRKRMEVLQRVSLYHEALLATTGEDFIRLVSEHWATDPKRGEKVMAIYAEYEQYFSLPDMPGDCAEAPTPLLHVG